MTGRLRLLRCSLFGLLLLGCRPASPGLGRPLEQADPAAVLRYARGLVYDTLRGVSDAQSLPLPECAGSCPAGPLVSIQPAHGSRTLTNPELAEGRVIARLLNPTGPEYPRFNLAVRDTVYWWVDSTRAGWRSVLISARAQAPYLIGKLEVERHDRPQYREPVARWLTAADQLPLPWVTCTEGGCCKLLE